MKALAIRFYQQGYNCSQCILKAAEAFYAKPISRQCYNMCQGVNTGFGIGGMCSVLIAGIMVFGLFFGDDVVKRLRIRLLTEFQSRHPQMDCQALRKERQGNGYCENIVGEIAELVEQLIHEELYP